MSEPKIPFSSSDNVGSNSQPVFLQDRELKAFDASAGGDTQLMKLVKGVFSNSTGSVGSGSKFIYLENGTFKASVQSIGGDDKIVKMVNGTLTVSTGSKGNNARFIYMQNGTLMESSLDLGSNVKFVYFEDGEVKASTANVGGVSSEYTVTSDVYPETDKVYYKADGAGGYTDCTSELDVLQPISSAGYDVYEKHDTLAIMFLQNGELKEASGTDIGSELQFLYLDGGKLKASTANVGDGLTLVYLKEGKLVPSVEYAGSDTKPLKLVAGKLVEVNEELAPKTAPAFTREGETRTLTAAEASVPTSTTPNEGDPATMIATKEYVDNHAGSGSGGSEATGFGGGVIDGVLCKDVDGNDVITELTKANGGLTSAMTKIEYLVKNDCYLSILMDYLNIGGHPGSNDDDLDIYVGDNIVSKLEEGPGGLESSASAFPVKAGSVVTIKGDGVTPVFDDMSDSSKLVIKEFRLNSLSVAMGMPDYSVDPIQVISPDNWEVPENGWLFAKITNSGTTLTQLYVDGRIVLAGCSSDNGDCSGMVPVAKGNKVSCSGTTSAVSIYFYPLAAEAPSTAFGLIEIPIDENRFTADATGNSFLPGGNIPSINNRTITSSLIKEYTGRDVDIKTASVTLRVDVFCPKMTSGFMNIDAHGFAVPDTTKPIFHDTNLSDHPDAGSHPAFNKCLIQDALVVMWNATEINTELYLPSLMSITGAMDGVPTIDYNNIQNITDACKYNALVSQAEALGLSDYYIRLTAVIDPNANNVVSSKSGMFVTGNIAKDENGNECKTLVPYTEWAAKQDSDGKYVYEYTVKTDCWLHANYLVHASTVYDEVITTINGEILSANAENSFKSDQVSTYSNCISMPVKRGTRIGFHSVSQPNLNWVSNIGDTDASEILKEPYAIKILEFKMGTELNPAQFPSLAVRVFDVDTEEEYSTPASTNKTYTWTESELRQIFGPMFSLDEAKVDFSATFYKATSADKFDEADKITDQSIVRSTGGTGTVVEPLYVSTTTDATGERILSVVVPEINLFITNVRYESDAFSIATSREHLGLSSTGIITSGVRMRLNMHISDRRGDMPDELLPNGISPNSKMVRQADMVMVAAASGPSYSNEITITESGICVLIGNIDSDGAITATDTIETVGIQALIGGEWRTLATQLVVSRADGCGNQNFSFNVEAGLKLRTMCNFGITEGEDSVAYTSSIVPELNTHKRVVSWVIPTGKYQNPELNLPGSAGVIDGSIWKDEDGNEITLEQTCDTTSTKYTYHVKNDCYLYIKLIDTSAAIIAPGFVSVRVNGVEAGRLSDVNLTQNPYYDNVSVGIPVSEGSVVELVNGLDESTNVFRAAGGKISFTEFKLRATNVLAAMPDWDESKAVKLGNGSVVAADGWIVFRVDDNTEMGSYFAARAYINGAEVYYWSWEQADGDNNTNTVNVPVCKGDVLTHTDVSGRMTCTFYPVKMTRTEYPDKMLVPNWSGDGTTIASGGAAPADGWVVVNATNRLGDGGLTVLVNGVSVWRSVDGSSNTKGYTANIPVAKNDIITVTSDYTTTIKFYPAKPATTTVSEADVLEQKINENTQNISDLQTNMTDAQNKISELETASGKHALKSELEALESTVNNLSIPTTATILNAVYPVGSVYIDASNATACPMAAAMSGSKWEQIGTKLLTDMSASVSIAADDTGVPEFELVTHETREGGTLQAVGGDGTGRGSMRYDDGTQANGTWHDLKWTNPKLKATLDSSVMSSVAVTLWKRTA